MYFQDLTPFTYSPAVCNSRVLNVGWLSHDAPFPIGDTSNEFRRALQLLAEHPVNLCVGHHDCEFCDSRQLELPSGNGEFHLPASGGAVAYAAPELVPHYVEVHRYLPPVEYIEAVVAYRAPEIPWEAIRNYWMSQLPPLDEKWNQWRFFRGGSLVEIFAKHQLPDVLHYLQRQLADELRIGTAQEFYFEVVRSRRDAQCGGIEIEQSRVAITCGSFSPTVRSCICRV